MGQCTRASGRVAQGQSGLRAPSGAEAGGDRQGGEVKLREDGKGTLGLEEKGTRTKRGCEKRRGSSVHVGHETTGSSCSPEGRKEQVGQVDMRVSNSKPPGQSWWGQRNWVLSPTQALLNLQRAARRLQ